MAKKLDWLAGVGPAIGSLQKIAAASVDALLAEGPVQPDYELLELCGEALGLVRRSKQLWEESFRVRDAALSSSAPYPHAEIEALQAAAREPERQFKPMLHRAKRLRAKTPAGIFAKALIVRASKTGAIDLAMSLAEDLVDSPALRSAIWSADPVTTSAGGV